MATFEIDEEAFLARYRLRTTSPTQWEDEDHGTGPLDGPTEAEQDSAGLRVVELEGWAGEPDPFGLRGSGRKKQAPNEERSKALRTLVQENFDRFVSVKASTDAVYQEMKDALLMEGNEYGTKDIKTSLQDSSSIADEIYLPILENTLRAQKLRSTLSVFERSKFFFNLPGSILSSIDANRPDQALSAYKKVLYILETRPGQLLPISTKNATQRDQQHRIVDKVWSQVEAIIGRLRNDLLALLKDGSRGWEDQEKTIEILLELDATDEPLWTYFDSQHNHVLGQLQNAHDEFAERVNSLRTSTDQAFPKGEEALEKRRALNLQRCVLSLSLMKEPEKVLENGDGHEVWKAMLDLVKNLSDVLLHSLPNFWRIAKHFLDGKYAAKTKNATPSRTPVSPISANRPPTQCRKMAVDIIKLYISLLASFFSFTPSVSNNHELPPFVPTQSTSLTSAVYANRILSEITECVNDINAGEISSEARDQLKNLLEHARGKFIEVICEGWRKDSEMIYSLEDWIPNPDVPSTTMYLSRIADFQNYNSNAAFKAATGLEKTSETRSVIIPPLFVARIKNSFFDSLYFLLDGMVRLSFQDYIPLQDPATQKMMVSVGMAGMSSMPDVTKIETRTLLTISNFGHLKAKLLPQLIKQFETSYGIVTKEDQKTLAEVEDQLDKILFDDYVRRKVVVLREIIRRGILFSGIDWYRASKPTEIGSYMYEALVFMVEVHAQISAVSKPLLHRSLSSLLEEMAKVALESFRQVKRFGMGGMLSATLSIEFMHQTLVAHVTPVASAILTEVYAVISKAYSRPVSESGDELQKELDAVKKTLYNSRKATSVEFMCLRKESTLSASSSASSAATGGSGMGKVTQVGEHSGSSTGGLTRPEGLRRDSKE
ncbi:Sec5 subunit of exocyst complex [Phaffia rhodozyma]|uniref:Exocyst complex component SEC5 n=1 Tax=Phaffia rhodozyma TaxID=264483 RepID=A0A0F7SRW5_PHARH|nr:Sec5 subunit of exocyst complex [Phaffia rhodozyma]